MKILYVFPHPDDESFGPAAAISKQRRDGHEVHLLTLTKGRATKQRHKYGYSVEQMGEVRYREMLGVEDVDVQNANSALDCYVTFQETIEKSGIRDHIGAQVVFEIFQESHDPPLSGLFQGLS